MLVTPYHLELVMLGSSGWLSKKENSTIMIKYSNFCSKILEQEACQFSELNGELRPLIISNAWQQCWIVELQEVAGWTMPVSKSNQHKKKKLVARATDGLIGDPKGEEMDWLFTRPHIECLGTLSMHFHLHLISVPSTSMLIFWSWSLSLHIILPTRKYSLPKQSSVMASSFSSTPIAIMIACTCLKSLTTTLIPLGPIPMSNTTIITIVSDSDKHSDAIHCQ